MLKDPRVSTFLGGCVLVAACVLPGAARAQDRTPNGAPGTVTLSRTDYDRLIDLAARQPSGPEPAPVPFALTRAAARVRVDDAVARATITLDGEVLHSGAVKVPMITRATLLDARLAAGSLALVAEKGTLAGIIGGPGPFTATLEWVGPLTMAPGRGSFVLPVPRAGSATAAIDVPGEQADPRVSPGVILNRASANGRTIVEVTLDPGSQTHVSWSTRDTSLVTPSRDSRFLADVKSLVTIGEADVRLLSIVDLTILQGELAALDVALPAGYELAGVTGTGLDRSEPAPGAVRLFLTSPAPRRQQILVSLERSSAGGSFRLETDLPSIVGAQRETGEVAVEGIGTLELGISELPALRRMDAREVSPALASAARQPLLAAFRYQRRPSASPALAIDVVRFADADVLAAIAERAVATTLITSEGRTLTEIRLSVRNRAQPYVKVVLPEGATVLSVDVAGAPARPVLGSDGTRIPLLRSGFRPNGLYPVSFVYLHAGSPFEKRGNLQMMLPQFDLPVTVVEWELFVPDRYRADRFTGNVIAADLVQRHREFRRVLAGSGHGSGAGAGAGVGGGGAGRAILPGQIAGRVVDHTGGAIPGVEVIAEASGHRQTVITDLDGWYAIDGLPSGSVNVTAQLAGFRETRRAVTFNQQPQRLDFSLQPGSLSETVTVTADSVAAQQRPEEPRASERAAQAAPSINVQNLQRRAAGVLPIRIEVPRAGTSHRFVRPLVVNEPTIVAFRYRRN